MTAAEGLSTQGIPAFDFLEQICGVRRPFDYSQFSITEVWGLAGNGQSTIVMGVALAFCLACTAPRQELQRHQSVLTAAPRTVDDSDDDVEVYSHGVRLS